MWQQRQIWGTWLHCVTLVHATHAWSPQSDTPIETSAAWLGSSGPAATSPCSSSLTYDNNILSTLHGSDLTWIQSERSLLFGLHAVRKEGKISSLLSSQSLPQPETTSFHFGPIWLRLVCRLPCDVRLGPCIMVCGMSQRELVACIPPLNRLQRQLCQWVDLVRASPGCE